MIFSAIMSFLGGHIFRQLLGEAVNFFTKQQDHAQELERMRLQDQLDAAKHLRNQEAIASQAALGIQVVHVQSEAAIAELETGAWAEVVKSTGRTVGIAWVDAWNATIRPAVATWSVLMVTLAEFKVITLSEGALSICSVALGIYLADRSLLKRGK